MTEEKDLEPIESEEQETEGIPEKELDQVSGGRLRGI